MKVARLIGTRFRVGERSELFPDINFPRLVTAEGMASFGCYLVSDDRPFNSLTEELVKVSPYLEGYTVYTVSVSPLDSEKLRANMVNAVIAERVRRLALGFDFDFGDSRGVHRIGTSEDDMVGWDDVSKWAQAKMGLGQSTSTITIVTGTGPAVITPLEWYAIIDAANNFRQPIWGASFALQAMDPIPDDFVDDAYWP